jgi:hypothetical protein
MHLYLLFSLLVTLSIKMASSLWFLLLHNYPGGESSTQWTDWFMIITDNRHKECLGWVEGISVTVVLVPTLPFLRVSSVHWNFHSKIHHLVRFPLRLDLKFYQPLPPTIHNLFIFLIEQVYFTYPHLFGNFWPNSPQLGGFILFCYILVYSRCWINIYWIN